MFWRIRSYATLPLKGTKKSIFKTPAFNPLLDTTQLRDKERGKIMASSTPVDSVSMARLSIAEQTEPSERSDKSKGKGKASKYAGGQKQTTKPNPSSSTKLRGMEKDSPEVRVSKTLSWLLRHGAEGEGLPMRKDGYVKITDLLEHPKLKAQGLDLERIKEIVKSDAKQRYDLISEPSANVSEVVGESARTTPIVGISIPSPEAGIWWIKARQGHSIKAVQLELKPITSLSDIPTGIAIHGTNSAAWTIISKEGLSKMKRNHIHLAQDVAGQGVVSGMRRSSKILIYIDIQKALDAGIKFWLSDNGVVLTEGNEKGYLAKEFFEKVVDSVTGANVAR